MTLVPQNGQKDYSNTDLHEYARVIGIDPDNEPELMWLAVEGLSAPMPPEWTHCKNHNQEIYYFNKVTKENSWYDPMDKLYHSKVVQERERLKQAALQKTKEQTEKTKTTSPVLGKCLPLKGVLPPIKQKLKPLKVSQVSRSPSELLKSPEGNSPLKATLPHQHQHKYLKPPEGLMSPEKNKEERRISRLQEELRREEEEAKRKTMEKEKRMCLLQEELGRKEEEAKEKLMRDKETRMCLLQKELGRQEDKAKEKLMKEKERRMCLLQEEIRSKEEEEKGKLMKEKEMKMFLLLEQFRSQEEEEKEQLLREKEKRMSVLKEELRRKEEEEREQQMKDNESKMCLMREELRRKEEQEKQRLKKEKEEGLRALHQHLLSERREEEARLREESKRILKDIQESIQKERDMQERKLREESEAMLKDIKERLEEERAVERDRLEVQERKNASKRLKMKKRLQKEREDECHAFERKMSELQALVDELELRAEELQRQEAKVADMMPAEEEEEQLTPPVNSSWMSPWKAETTELEKRLGLLEDKHNSLTYKFSESVSQRRTTSSTLEEKRPAAPSRVERYPPHMNTSWRTPLCQGLEMRDKHRLSSPEFQHFTSPLTGSHHTTMTDSDKSQTVDPLGRSETSLEREFVGFSEKLPQISTQVNHMQGAVKARSSYSLPHHTHGPPSVNHMCPTSGGNNLLCGSKAGCFNSTPTTSRLTAMEPLASSTWRCPTFEPYTPTRSQDMYGINKCGLGFDMTYHSRYW